jgi:hypothetical protein
MLSSWHMYEMHLALFLKGGCDTELEKARPCEVHSLVEMAMGTQNPNTRRVLPYIKAGTG